MKLEFLGAAQTVTGSMHMLTVNGTRILMDCGLYQGRRAESFERNRNLPFDATEVDVLVLSHAHIDHSGNIPSLVKSGFQGNIFVTPGTRDLCSIMLRDSAHIQEADARYVNKKRRRAGQPPVEPLYTKEDAKRSLNYLVSINYERRMPIAPGVTLTFYDAGHILGSAMVSLDIEENGQRRRLLFTGDLGRPDTPLLQDPAVPAGVNVLITESTYGNRLHQSGHENIHQLRDIVNRVHRRGGKLIIPAFSVGRTQGIVYALHQLMDGGEIPELRVFVDSPLSVNVAEIFRHHPECYDSPVRSKILTETNPYGFERLKYVRDVARVRNLAPPEGPCVIISPTESCESGRIQGRLLEGIGDPRNLVLLLDPFEKDTLAWKLARGEKSARILGEQCHVEAEVASMKDFSGLADMDDLVSYTQLICENSPKMRRIFLFGAGTDPSPALKKRFEREVGLEVVVPQPGKPMEV